MKPIFFKAAILALLYQMLPGAAGCTLRILTKKDVQPNETLADFYRVRSPQECLQMCVDYQRGGSCLSAVYRDYGKCSLKSSSIAAAIDAPNATWIIVYCGDGEAASNDGSGTAGDTGITGDTAFPPPTLGDGFTSQDNVKRDGATRVNVRWNQSIDQCIALCENEQGCAHVNYRKSSRGCFMLKDDGTPAADSAFTLLTLGSGSLAPPPNATDDTGAAGDTGNTAYPAPTLGDGFTSQDNVKRDGATGVNVRWNQSIDQCIALCENEEGCAHVNYRKSSRGCFMLRDDGTLAGDSAFKLLTLGGGSVAPLPVARGSTSQDKEPDTACILTTIMEADLQPGLDILTTSGMATRDECLASCNANAECNAAVYSNLYQKCWHKAASYESGLSAPGSNNVVVYCGSGSTTTGGGDGSTGACILTTITEGDMEPGMDVKTVQGLTTGQACLNTCSANAACNAAVWSPGRQVCWHKSASHEDVVPSPGSQNLVVFCGSGGTASAAGGGSSGRAENPTLDPSLACKTFQEVEGQHIVVGSLDGDFGGEVIMNGNSRSWQTSSVQACWDLCMRTKGCRGATYGIQAGPTKGQCFLKPYLALQDNFGPNSKYASIFPPRHISKWGDTGSTTTCAATRNTIGISRVKVKYPEPYQTTYRMVFSNNSPDPPRPSHVPAVTTSLSFPSDSTKLCGGGPYTILATIYKKDGCTPCADAFCLIWAPNKDGFYTDNCSTRLTTDENGQFWYETSEPGNESKVGYGNESSGHWHYDCSGCGQRIWSKMFMRPGGTGFHGKYSDLSNYIEETCVPGVYDYAIKLE